MSIVSDDVCAPSNAAAREFQVAVRADAEQVPVIAVREQQFGFVGGEHGDGGVEAFEHGREALVRGGEFLARALGLGDVRHRRHPAGLAARAVDQRRHVEPRVEERAVLAAHAQFEARTRAPCRAASCRAGAASRGYASRGQYGNGSSCRRDRFRPSRSSGRTPDSRA